MKKIPAAIAVLTLLAVPAVPVMADGASVYKAKCALCHGENGSGDTKMGKKLGLKDLRSPEMKKKSDQEIVKVITDGKDKMPAFKSKLSTKEILEVTKFVKGLK